jgi:glutaredoxin 3
MRQLSNKTMKQHHTIEIFSADCPLCRHIIDDIQVGKCQGCNQTVYDVNRMNDEVKRKMRDYGITSVPTTIIDGNIKVVGIPDFPWICGEDLYLKLKREYALGKKTNH